MGRVGQTQGASHPGKLALVCISLVGLAGSAPPAASPAGSAGSKAPAQTTARTTTPASAPATIDDAVRLLSKAQQTYQGVRDYTCVFIKREQLDGSLQPENVMSMKIRTEPLSISMRWLAPKGMIGQEVCYVAGQNEGMMRVHPAGLLGAVGFVSLDPRDARAMAGNRHCITEAGLGNLMTRLAKHYEVSRRAPETRVVIADYEYNHRRCTRVEVFHPDRHNGMFRSGRCVVYFDKEIGLPIRIENYDFPRAGGPPQGELLESYSFVDLRVNVGLTDAVFDR